MSKVVLITGGTSGIGKATSILLSSRGFKVYATGRNVDKVRDLEEKGITLLYMNLLDEESIRNAFDEVIKREGKIDILINNAGYGIAGSVEDVPIDEARKQFEVNLFAPIRLSQLAIPKMRENGGGRIINITSIASFLPSPILSWYSASKSAFGFLSFAMRVELSRFGIDVVSVAPAGISTNWPLIALSYLEKFSSNSLYSKVAERMFKFFENSIKSSPSPEIVAKKIYKIIMKKKTKPVYFVPWYAKLFYFTSKVLPITWLEKAYKLFLSD